MPGIVGPNGQPVMAQQPEQRDVEIGGRTVGVFVDPRVGKVLQYAPSPAFAQDHPQEAAMFAGMANEINISHLYVQALVRECVELAERVTQLESTLATVRLEA